MKNIKNFEAFNESEQDPENPKLEDNFDHMGYDDDNVLIGCCKHCGGNGVDVLEHAKTCEKIPGNGQA